MSSAIDARPAIEEMVRRIAEGFSPDRIILFGSHARGDAREDSDVDLLVLFRELDDPRARATDVYVALIGCWALPADIVVSTTDRFNRYRNVVNTVYCRPPGRAELCMSAPPEVVEIVRQWVRKAEHDLEAVRRIMAVEEGCPYDMACFHRQQAIEKYLKALLTLSGIPALRTHDLERLLAMVPPHRRPSIPAASLAAINPYAVEACYADDWREPRREDAVRR